MLEKFIFENHLGQRIDGSECGIFLNYNDLRDYDWAYDTLNGKISRFRKDIKKKKLPLVLKCDSEEEAIQTKNRLFEVAETDIFALIPGRIYVGDYYMYGYITESKKTNYLISKTYTNFDLAFTPSEAYWFKEETYSFKSSESSNVAIGGDLGYPYDFPFDYCLPQRGRRLFLKGVGEYAFRLVIYGKAENPSIKIGSHTYAVNGSIGENEYLEIDSLARTITLTTAYTNKINWLDKRSREEYIFQPIPAGEIAVGWVGDFNFDLTIIEMRSEPLWT